MTLQNLTAVQVSNVEVLGDAALSPEEMCSMNFAREEFDKLYALLWPMLSPMLNREGDTRASEAARHLEQVRIFTGNFCWRHRHLGASYGVVGKRAGIDVEVE